jgi:hypothetical protein
VSGGIDLDVGPDHDVVANMHLVAIQNGAQDIQKYMIADIDVLAVATVEGGFDDRILTDLAQQLLEDGLSFRLGFGLIVEPEQCLGPFAFRLQVRIKTVVDLSG